MAPTAPKLKSQLVQKLDLKNIPQEIKPMLTYVLRGVSLFALVIPAIILAYLNKLKQEACSCAINKKFTFMYYYLIASISYSVLIFTFPGIIIDNLFSLTGTFVQIFSGALAGTFIVAGFLYIRELEELEAIEEKETFKNQTPCTCSVHWMRTFFKYYVYVMIVVYTIILINVLLKQF
jgi:hypothetical protein